MVFYQENQALGKRKTDILRGSEKNASKLTLFPKDPEYQSCQLSI